MAIRYHADGTVEADSGEELDAYLASRSEHDLRTVMDERGRLEPSKSGFRGFFSPLVCIVPRDSGRWILSPIACFYRPEKK